MLTGHYSQLNALNNWLCHCSWIYSTLPANKQMITLSATYPESLAQHITSYMRSPVFVRLNASDPSLIGDFLTFPLLVFSVLNRYLFLFEFRSFRPTVLSVAPLVQCVVCRLWRFVLWQNGTLAKNYLKEWIGNQGQKVYFGGRRHISASGFASMATETAVIALFLPIQPSNRY